MLWDLYAVRGVALLTAAYVVVLLLAIFFRSLWTLAWWLLGFASAVLVARILLAYSHRCPDCGRHPTIELSDDHLWARTLRDVGRKRRFNCLHCGSAFTVSPR
jgi:hypothetical protein